MKSGGIRLAGYTIVEVMIFLAVSGVMFIIAATFINGKEANAEFMQANSDISTRLQQALNNVVNGYYPTQENFTCTPAAAGPTFTNMPKQQGTNNGCIYIGEVIQFGVTGTQGEGYAVIPVVGNRLSGTQEVTSFAQARPTALTADKTNGLADMADKRTLLYNMHVTKMELEQVSGGSYNHIQDISAFGVFSTFGSYANNALQSGAQDINLTTVPSMGYTYNGSYIDGRAVEGNGSAASTRISQMAGYADSSLIIPDNQDVRICFKDGYNRRSSLTVGANNGRLNVQSQTGANVPTSGSAGCP